MAHGLAIEMSLTGISRRLAARVLAGNDRRFRARFTLTANDAERWQREWANLQARMTTRAKAA